MKTKILSFCLLWLVLVFPCFGQRVLKQSTAYNLRVFMADSTDHVSGKASLTLTITAAKSGTNSLSSISPTVVEIGSGWYDIALTTTHTNTVGDMAIHVTGTGADPTDTVIVIRENVLGDILPANITQWNSSAIATPDTAGYPKVTVKDGTGTGEIDTSSGHIANVDTLTTYTGNTPQTGDSFARIGATGSGLTSLAPSSTALSTAQWTNTRAGYLDNINNSALQTTTAQTGDSFARIGSTGSGLTSLAPSSTALSTSQWTNTRAGYLDNINNSALLTTVAQTGDSFARIGAPAGASISADIAAVKVDTAAIKTKTNFLPSVTAGQAGGVFIAGTNAATTVDITGSLSGSIGSLSSIALASIADANGVLISNAPITAAVSSSSVKISHPFTGIFQGTYTGAIAIINEIDSNGDSIGQEVKRIVSATDSSGDILLTFDSTSINFTTQCTVTIIAAPNQLETIRAKLPSKTYLAGSNNSDGDIQLDEATGTLPANSITATSIATGAIVNGTEASGFGTAQTGDAYAIVNSGTFGNSALKTLLDAIKVVTDKENTSLELNSGNYRFTTAALANAPSSGSGLTQQQVRDAMKLTPSIGTPAAESVDKKLDQIKNSVNTK